MKWVLRAGCAAVAVLVLAGAPARAVDQEAINKAIDNGVAYLRSPDVQNHNFTQAAGISGVGVKTGVMALVGLALLECGVPPDDPAVRHAVEVVRPDSVTCNETYPLSLSILFLDRLGDPADAPLIESMTVRLLAGQSSAGGWNYNCPNTPDSEVRRLSAVLKQQAELVSRPGPPKDDKDKPARPTVKELPKEIQEQLALINASANNGQPLTAGDNSNTQFAALALWVARRHGLPVDRALARLNLRFRASQNNDGGWSYMPGSTGSMDAGVGGGLPGGSSGSMTCSGLLGLAVAYGAAAEKALDSGKAVPDPSTDRVVKKALEGLGTVVGDPIDADGKLPQMGGKVYYFFWSLERVGVVYDLKTIGGKDWYSWGASILVAAQQPNGSWDGGEHPTGVDTCFALLFLKRANLVRDLTSALKGKSEPDSVTLHSGDVVGGPPKGVETKEPGPGDVIGPPRPKDPVQTHPAAEETEGGRMARELVQAPPEKRGELVEQYRDGKGVNYTEALAGAIPQLTGEDKGKARDALAERLTRMKEETLARYFGDQDAEIRRAAALAAAMKEAKTLVPDLIPLLADSEPAVAHAAHAALKDLTGENLGPAVEEWKAWWKDKNR